ncbi:histone-like nucleoid-structuring protein Lsr2 [Microbacterium sp. 179-I 3D3 NHS]|uniref:exonuclease domain-containing protein n=1 Tax=Microbacterium sp. 179-I 3D3 NHS TaxID=3142382 RepID=UPI0039A3783D
MGFLDWVFGKRAAPAGLTNADASQGSTQRRMPLLAVVDVETTGLSPRRDRVVELAVVRIDGEGNVLDEWSTRFNPEGSVGATHIHGITDADVMTAPFFRDVAPQLIPYIAGVPIAAHNAKFDLAFLQAEFQRAGWDTPRLPAFCTLDRSREYFPELDRRRLVDCCWAAGVTLESAHSALGDARATAGLLRHYLTRAPRHQNQALEALRDDARSVRWPSGPSRAPGSAVVTQSRDLGPRPRRITPARPTQPPLLRQMTDLSLFEALEEGAPDGAVVYLETLLDALEDGQISDEEAGDLGELISVYGLDDVDLHSAHRAFILALAHRAVDDGHVSTAEREELFTLCDALEVSRAMVNELIAHASAARAARMSADLSPLPGDWSLGVPLRVGDKVAFTGCDDRQRARLEGRASELGVRVMNNVSRFTAMLVTDGTMVGTKLAKAREIGTRIVHPDTFAILLAHLQPTIPVEVRLGTTAGRRSGASLEKSAPRVEPSNRETSPSVVRTWALANGFTVGVRGRISAEIWDAFAAALVSDTAPLRGVEADARIHAFEFQGEPMAPLGEWAYAPLVPNQAMGLTGGADIHVVQSSAQQEQVRSALQTWEENGEDSDLIALLVAEPHNPRIVHAVRIDLLVGRERTVAGYLPETHSETFHQLVKSAMDIGALPMMKVHVSASAGNPVDLDLRLVHLDEDPERTSVTDEIVSRTNERRARELGSA